MGRTRGIGFVVWLATIIYGEAATAETYYVATDGDDQSGDGSSDNPWATIGHAVNDGIAAAGGDTVVVRDGVYSGQSTIRRGFALPVLVRAESSYRAVLTNVDGGGEALRIYVEGSANLTFEGFVFTNRHPSYTCPGGRETMFLIHIQDASDVVLRDNVIFGNNAPGTCNELLKINRGNETSYPRNIVIQGNLFFEPANAGGADMIDAVRPGEIDIVENIFVGSPERDRSQSFITIKRQAPTDTARSPRFVIARNVFVNWGGATDQAFVQLGEDGQNEVMVSDALIENNLFIGNSPARQAAPVQLKGSEAIVIRANTIVGDLPSGSYGFRVGTEGDNPPVAGYEIYNTIFCDPTGTMGARLVNVYGLVDTSSFVLDHNLAWNGGEALPSDGDVTLDADANLVTGDPLLEVDQSGLTFPLWDHGASRFPSGSETIRAEHLRLVETYGALGVGSPAIGAADPATMPATDIRGLVRDDSPDIGAYEHGATTPDGDADADADGDGDADADGDGDADADGDGPADGGEEGCACGASGRSSPPVDVAALLAIALVLVRVGTRW